MGDRPRAGHSVGPTRFEAAKIVSPPQAFRRPPHGIGIQSMPALMTIPAQERIGRRPVVDHIPIKLAFSIAVGIKCLRHIRRLANHDVGWQMSIQGSNQYIGRMLGCCVEVDDLADRVNTGVGSPAGIGMRSFTSERGDGGLEGFLHGSKPRLRLPAEEVGAIVAQGQLDVAHRTAQDSSFHPPRQDPLRQMVRKSPQMLVFLEDFDPLRQFHLAGGGGVECKSASPRCFFGLPPNYFLWRNAPGYREPGSQLRWTRTSAICTALLAAPLRRLSATTQRFSP